MIYNILEICYLNLKGLSIAILHSLKQLLISYKTYLLMVYLTKLICQISLLGTVVSGTNLKVGANTKRHKCDEIEYSRVPE